MLTSLFLEGHVGTVSRIFNVVRKYFWDGTRSGSRDFLCFESVFGRAHGCCTVSCVFFCGTKLFLGGHAYC